MPDTTMVVVWLAAVVGTYIVLFWIAAWWARRTPNDIDDVVVGVLQWPVLLVLLISAVIDLTRRSELPVGAIEAVARGGNVLLIMVVTWGVWRLVRDTVLYYGRHLAARTEANFDDVLFPVLDVLAPVVIIATGAILLLRLLGADISTVVMTAGGAALFVGLSLGDTLKNILGGLMLLVDTPFRFGDLIVLDGVVCQIKKIGLRVTTLYNTESHADVFVANSVLATTKLTNLTRPSPDLRVRVFLPIADAALISGGRELIQEMAEANPYVLGNVPRKLQAMRRALACVESASARAQELEWGLSALGCELALDECLDEMQQLLNGLLEMVQKAEHGGLSRQEQAVLADEVRVLDAYDEKVKAAMRVWAKARTADPQLVAYAADRQRLHSDAEARVSAWERHMVNLHQYLASPDLSEAQRLDDLIVELKGWLPRSFKQITPAWKYPLVQALHVDFKGISLLLFVYIDDIHLEGFVRQTRVMDDLFATGMAALRALQNQRTEGK